MHFEEIEKQVVQWIETINIEEFCKNVTNGRKEETFFKQKPGFDFLSDKNKENYITNMAESTCIYCMSHMYIITTC